MNVLKHVKVLGVGLIRNSYYRASRAYRVYCTRPEGASRPRVSYNKHGTQYRSPVVTILSQG